MNAGNNFINPMNFDGNNQADNNLIRPMDFDVRTKSVEEKIYIILYKINDDTGDDIYNNIYSICIGRSEAFLDIKNKLVSGLSIDIHRSKIMTETKQTESNTGDRKYFMIPYEECISIYSFCLSLKEYYSDDDFDIEEYNDSEIPEDSNDMLTKNPRYLSAEQQEYKKLLDASMKRDKFLTSIKNDMNGTNNI